MGGDDGLAGQSTTRPVPCADTGQKGEDRKRRHLDIDDLEYAFRDAFRENIRQPPLVGAAQLHDRVVVLRLEASTYQNNGLSN